MAKTCVICGKPSGMYPLCVEHLKAKNDGSVVKCEECKTWHYVDKPCKCNTTANTTEPAKEYKEKEIATHSASPDKPTPVEVKFINNEGCCLTCGKPAEGKMFCKSCYHKYKNKTLLVKISKCDTLEVLDESYEGIYVCKDGHVVKSKSERDIDNYLFDKQIRHVYEKEIRMFDGTPIHPDFYLPDRNAYIEHWGYDESNIKYTETKNMKMDFYHKKGLTLICTYEKSDAKDIESALDWKLDPNNYKQGEVNFEE